MNDNEKLIKEAAKAIYEAQVEESTFGDLACAALAVFESARVSIDGAGLREILTEAHSVWVGIDRGTHTASDLDEVLDPRRWKSVAQANEQSEVASGVSQ